MAAEAKTLAAIAEGRLDTAWIDAALTRIGCDTQRALQRRPAHTMALS